MVDLFMFGEELPITNGVTRLRPGRGASSAKGTTNRNSSMS